MSNDKIHSNFPNVKAFEIPIYDTVAEMYEATFTDFTVRSKEWNWIINQINISGHNNSVLEIGCGNGAMINHLAPFAKSAVGIDISPRLLEYARKRNAKYTHVQFIETSSSQIPIQNHSFDVIISVLSWRYLDWYTTMQEVRRLLKPGGKLLLIDMCRHKIKPGQFLNLAKEKIQLIYDAIKNPAHHKNLRSMVKSQSWKALITKNPPKTKCEYERFFRTNFNHTKIEILSVGWRHEVIAIKAGF